MLMRGGGGGRRSGVATWVGWRGVGWQRGVRCSCMNADNAHARDRRSWMKYGRGTEGKGCRSSSISPWSSCSICSIYTQLYLLKCYDLNLRNYTFLIAARCTVNSKTVYSKHGVVVIIHFSSTANTCANTPRLVLLIERVTVFTHHAVHVAFIYMFTHHNILPRTGSTHWG